MHHPSFRDIRDQIPTAFGIKPYQTMFFGGQHSAAHDLPLPTGTKVVIMQMPTASEADAPAVLRVVPLFGGEAVTWISIQWLSHRKTTY